MLRLSCIVVSLFGFQIISAQRIPVPQNFVLLDSVQGDLDKDGVDEMVVAYNTRKEDDSFESIPRQLRIYKMQDGKWAVWKISDQALYGSTEGGMSGDPYGGMEIKNGILLMSHAGGSSWKWGHTDKYRYQDGEFYLIGYSSTAGKPCEYWMDIDFNLLTGKMIVKKEYENCESADQEIYKRENETIYRKGLRISLQNRREKEIKMISPRYKHEIYIATRME